MKVVIELDVAVLDDADDDARWQVALKLREALFAVPLSEIRHGGSATSARVRQATIIEPGRPL